MHLLMKIKRYYSKWHASYKRFKAYIESRIIRIRMPCLNINDEVYGKIMILAPHSDDEWVGCSCLIQGNNHVLVVNMDMMGGDAQETHMARYNEMLSMSIRNKTDIVTVLGDEKNKIAELGRVIEEFQPEFICVPFYYDWHKEHLLTREILYDAIRENELIINKGIKVVEYQVSVPIPFNLVTNCKKMSEKQQESKWNCFSDVYKTQTFFPIWRYKYNEYISGKICDFFSCECFCVHPIQRWVDQFKNNLITENQRQIIMARFQNLSKIRGVLDQFEQKKRNV